MTRQELIEKINEFNEDNTTIEFYIANKGNEYTLYRCQIDENVNREIFSMLKIQTLSLINNNELNEFNPIGKEDGTIELLDAQCVEGFININNCIDNDENICDTIDELGDINFYVLNIRNGNDNIKVFRRYSKSKSLSRGILMSIFGNTFDKIQENVFQIDNIIDFISINQQDIVVFNRYSFEIITNYKDYYTNNLNNALNTIEQNNIINGIENFKIDCTNSTKIAKQFTKAMNNNSINLILAHPERFNDAIRQANLPIEFLNGQFIYEGKEQLSILVELLTDRYARTLIGQRITNGQ